MSFAIRGVIEGFYGRLWPWPVRERFAAATAARGFNVYAYAPKEDRLQNAAWRSPYPDDERRRLAAFGERCRAAGMELWIGLRPVGISYADDRDASTVVDKLTGYMHLGASAVVLLADDIPSQLDASAGGRFGSLAEAHLWLIGQVLQRLDAARLVFVPTDYHGSGSEYLGALGAGLPAGVELCWTGAEVCSPAITSGEARAIARVLGRPPLIWDNYPVNDALMVDELHIGPIRDRDPDLDRWVSGILVNPAIEAEASLVPMATWADYLRDPASYDPDASWRRALLSVSGGDGDADAVAALAALRDRSVIHQPWRRPSDPPIDPAARRAASVTNAALADDLRRFVDQLPPPP